MSSSIPDVYDFIVVGGGTSGALVAGNLARSRQRPRVLVIESGGDNKNPELRVASERFTNVYLHEEIRVPYKTVPQKHVKGRVFDYLRGKGLGGSSIANYEAYIRGAASDFDEWADRVGDDFFAWKNAVRRYMELENLHFDEGEEDKDGFVRLKDDAHGFEGPLDISIPSRKQWALGMDKIMEAAIGFGWPVCYDQNQGNPIGLACVTTTSYKGFRTTSGSAYLYDVLPNLEIWCHAKAARILWEHPASGRPKAVGVQLVDGRVARARSEVIVSTGPTDSPKLLMLSGIGPRKHLEKLSIDCLVDMPDVGANMFDHCFVQLTWSVDPVLSDRSRFESDKESQREARKEWLRSRTGPEATRNLSNFIGFFKLPNRTSRDELKTLPERTQNWINKADVPEIEIFVGGVYPADWRLHYTGEFFAINIMLMNPQSLGSVCLESNDPLSDPVIDPNYLAHPYDKATLIDGVREAVDFVKTSPLSRLVKEAADVPQGESDEDILNFCQDNLGTVLHACSTVRMGHRDDRAACLDTDFRVRGVDNLRVIDLSAIPLMTNNHTMATAFVVGQMGWTKIAKEYGLSLPARSQARI